MRMMSITPDGKASGQAVYTCECGGKTPLPAEACPRQMYCLYCGKQEPIPPGIGFKSGPAVQPPLVIADLVVRVAVLEAENTRLTDLTNKLVEWVTGQYESQGALNRIKAWVAEDQRKRRDVGP